MQLHDEAGLTEKSHAQLSTLVPDRTLVFTRKVWGFFLVILGIFLVKTE